MSPKSAPALTLIRFLIIYISGRARVHDKLAYKCTVILPNNKSIIIHTNVQHLRACLTIDRASLDLDRLRMDDDAEFRRERDALQSRIDELAEVLRRLTGMLEAAAAKIHEHRDGDGQPAVVAGGADPYCYGDDGDPSDEPEYPVMPWEQHHHYYLRNDTFGQQQQQQLTAIPDGATAGPGHLQLQAEAAGDSAAGSGGDHHGGQHLLLSDPALYNEDGDRDRDMTAAGEATTPARFSDGGGGGGGFGGVPASAAAIASLEKQRHDGSGADSMCTICMRHYKRGKRLSVMPCAFKHRFHRKCLRKWLSRSHLCPLCRHALPTRNIRYHENQRGELSRGEYV
jgi:hypothetical protein